MSMELLPPDPVYPKAYHVRDNWCRCHPETCCCNDYAVHAPDGTKYSTHFHEDDAIFVAESLNVLNGLTKLGEKDGHN